jgi:polyisoprenoid-binding protein YceI
MFKKLILAGMAIAAFAAFMMPAAASASPVLTSEGVKVPLLTKIIGTSTETPTLTGAFNVTCSKAKITGTVTKNSGTNVEATVPVGGATYEGTGTNGDCTSALGSTKVTVNSELCLASAANDTVNITGCLNAKEESLPVTFTLEITGTGPCKYKTALVNGTHNTNITPATIKVSEQEAKLEEGGFFCPASGKLDQDFDLYTDNLPTETPLTIS